MASSLTLINRSNSGLILPGDILLDTSFITILGTPSHCYYQQADSFVQECLSRGTSLYCTTVVVNELTHHYEKVFTKEEATLLGINVDDPLFNKAYGHKELQKQIYSTNPTFSFTAVANKTDAIITKLVDNTDILPQSDGDSYVSNLMKAHKKIGGVIESNDISILIEGHEYGINSIATADKGYFYVDGINVFAVPTKDYRTFAQTSPRTIVPHDPDWLK